MMWPALTVFERDFIVFRRELVAEMITTLAMPLTFLMAFGWGLGGYVSSIEGMPYLEFVIPGLITMTAVLSAFEDAAWGLWFHRTVQGTINEYRVNPLTTRDIIMGKILSGFFKASVKGIIVGVILVIFAGFRPHLPYVALFVLFLLPACVLFSCLGSLAGTLIDTPESLGRTQAVVLMPLIFLGGVFFPLTSYPETLRFWVQLLPTTAVFEGSRQALLRGELNPLFLGITLLAMFASFFITVEAFERRLSD